MSDFQFPEFDTIEDELMKDPTFALGWRCGMAFQCCSLLATGFFEDVDVIAARQIFPGRAAGIVLNIAERTGVHVHTHELGNDLIQACFIKRPVAEEEGGRD